MENIMAADYLFLEQLSVGVLILDMKEVLGAFGDGRGVPRSSFIPIEKLAAA